MPAETTKEAYGQKRPCAKCNVRIGSFEKCVEINNKPYHTGCDPTKK